MTTASATDQSSQIEDAIVQRNEALAIALINTFPEYARVSRPWQNGAHSLPEACGRGLEKLVAVMLAHGAEVHTTDAFNGTGLAYAVKAGHVSLAEMLLNHQANPNRVEMDWSFDNLALHGAAMNNHPTAVNLLLAHGANPDLVTPMDAMTALMCACKYGGEEAALPLIRVTDLDLRDHYGRSARDFAVKNNQKNIISAIDVALASNRARGFIFAMENESKSPCPSF